MPWRIVVGSGGWGAVVAVSSAGKPGFHLAQANKKTDGNRHTSRTGLARIFDENAYFR